MNRSNVYRQLKIDEGVKYEIYNDHLGLPTVGVGHLILTEDAEYGKPLGTPISEERSAELFEQDLDLAISEANKLYDDFDDLPDEVQEIIVNMIFNLGRPRLAKFKGMRAGVDARDWNKAADEMVDSRWYNQVTNRADRLVQRMRTV